MKINGATSGPKDFVRYAGIRRHFRIDERNSTLSLEIVAGFTTFGAMSYIIVVNPAILAATGVPVPSLIVTTILAAIVGTLFMALWGNLPIALAPGMGSNIVFAQIVVVQMGVSYGTALAMVLAGGMMFTILSATRWRERIVLGFPEPIRIGIQCGLGLFIAYLGLQNGGLVSHTNNSVSFGSLANPAVLLAFAGVLATPVLLALRAPAAFLLSIIAMTLAGVFVQGLNGVPLTALPDRIVALPTIPTELFLAFDFREFFTHFWLVLPITIYFFLSDFFSATATLMAVTRRGNIMDADGNIPNSRRAFTADGVASIVGASLGQCTVVAFVESAAGVEAGGRTGLTAVVVAALFALALFLWPFFAIVPPQATAPALIFVGVLMLEGIRDIDASCPENLFPPILILIITVVTTNLLMAMAAGCFTYSLIVIATRQWQKLTPILLGLDLIFVAYIVLVTSAL